MKIFAVVFDPEFNGSCGGNEWRFSESDARAYFAEHVREHPSDNVTLFECDVPDDTPHNEIAAWVQEWHEDGDGRVMLTHTAVDTDEG